MYRATGQVVRNLSGMVFPSSNRGLDRYCDCRGDNGIRPFCSKSSGMTSAPPPEIPATEAPAARTRAGAPTETSPNCCEYTSKSSISQNKNASYAREEAGGGRCWRACSERYDAGVNWVTCPSSRPSMGLEADPEEGGTKPGWLTPPTVNSPQLLPQELLEMAWPAIGSCACIFRQQDFACFLQQEAFGPSSVRAASGTREANNRSNARHAAVTLRTKRKLWSIPSILCGLTIPRPR
jgi:hypothetical protein